MNNHRRLMQIPSPRYRLNLDYMTKDGNTLHFTDAKYSYTLLDWQYKNDWENGLYPESMLEQMITESEEHRVNLDAERQDLWERQLSKQLGI